MKAGLRRWTERHLARQKRPLDVLGIGDGLSFDCLHLARKQHRVTYIELPGKSERFAWALFERSGANVAVLTNPAEIAAEATMTPLPALMGWNMFRIRRQWFVHLRLICGLEVCSTSARRSS